MRAEHFEILVEEQSMEEFLREFLPKFFLDQATFAIYSHQGKSDLLNKLQSRLRAYRNWLPEHWRIVVLVDRDDENCHDLKGRLEEATQVAGLRSKTNPGHLGWQVVNRIAIEELEAWFFGCWSAVGAAYPKVSASIPKIAAYRHPDNILGGTWEAMERILKRAGYHASGLRKLELAAAIGREMDTAQLNQSPSFNAFCDALREAMT